ncbi:MAG: flagellar hook-length control protein FliK [Planctomycetota bacterium]
MIQAPAAQIQPSQPQLRTAEPAQSGPQDFADVLTRHQEPDAAPPDADAHNPDAVETAETNPESQPASGDEATGVDGEAPADAPDDASNEASGESPVETTDESAAAAVKPTDHALPAALPPEGSGRSDARIATAPAQDAPGPSFTPPANPGQEDGPKVVQGTAGGGPTSPVSNGGPALPATAPLAGSPAQTTPQAPVETPPPPPSTQPRIDGGQAQTTAAASSMQPPQSQADTSGGDFGRDEAPRQQPFAQAQSEAKPPPQSAPEAPQPIFRLVPQESTAQMSRSMSAEVAQQTESGPRLASDADAEPPALASIRRGLGTVLSQRGGSLTMRLTPATLGSVRIDMAIDGGTVNVRIEAGTSQAQDLLKQNLTSLRTALEARGLVVDRLGVHISAHASSSPLQTESQSDPGTQRQDDARHDASDGRSRGSSDGREQPEDERGGAAEGQTLFSDVLQQGVEPDGDGWRLSLDATV